MPSQVRSAVSNGSRILDGIDHRSTVARRYRDITQSISSDLGNDLTEAQLQLARSAAGLAILREFLDKRIINGEGRVEAVEYCRISNSLTRVLSVLGCERLPRDITPNEQGTLERILASLEADEITDVDTDD